MSMAGIFLESAAAQAGPKLPFITIHYEHAQKEQIVRADMIVYFSSI